MYVLFSKTSAKIDTGVRNNVIDFDNDAPNNSMIRLVDNEAGGMAVFTISIGDLRVMLTERALGRGRNETT